MMNFIAFVAGIETIVFGFFMVVGFIALRNERRAADKRPSAQILRFVK
ncbi:hypothetical protein [Bradyrhizobium sp. Leo121]|nr:hypothetical protein [Bradyrhizobium sp. Leo121]